MLLKHTLLYLSLREHWKNEAFAQNIQLMSSNAQLGHVVMSLLKVVLQLHVLHFFTSYNPDL